MAELTATRTVVKDAALSRPLDAPRWQEFGEDLAAGQKMLVDLWGDTDRVHMAVTEPGHAGIRVVSLLCPDKRFPSIGRTHPPAIRLERAVRDLYGIEPEGLPDQRPWLDHGKWPVRQPLGKRTASAAEGDRYSFLPVEGDGLHQIPVGPVHAGINEPGHFRFTASGETVVRLEERLGYVHKGIDSLMRGASSDTATRLAGRVSGDSTVAYATAFARAVEAALGVTISERAVWLRALMAELERIANHLGDIGAVCNDASFALMHAHCGMLRERVLRVADGCFGHRLMMDRILPGGITVDAAPDGLALVSALIEEIGGALPRLFTLYEETTSLQDRTVGTGIVKPDLALSFACGGPIGRASGRAFDARRAFAYAPYDRLHFTVPTRSEGDVDARLRIRFDEVTQSLGLIRQILAQLPGGSIRASGSDAARAGEGMALVESFRGDVLVWLAL